VFPVPWFSSSCLLSADSVLNNTEFGIIVSVLMNDTKCCWALLNQILNGAESNTQAHSAITSQKHHQKQRLSAWSLCNPVEHYWNQTLQDTNKNTWRYWQHTDDTNKVLKDTDKILTKYMNILTRYWRNTWRYWRNT
jgi:hypothetical protein